MTIDLCNLYKDVLLPAGDPAWLFAELAPGPADPWQRAVCADESPYIYISKVRRCGGTELAVTLAARAMLQGRQVICIAPTANQSWLLGRRLRAACAKYSASGKPGSEKLRPTNQSREQLITEGGGWAVFAPGANSDFLRGHDLDAKGNPGEPGYVPGGLLIWDEMAYQENDEEMWRVVSPMIDGTRGGQVVGISTPGYVGTLAHRIATQQEEGWSVHVVDIEAAQRTYTPERLALARKMSSEAGQRTELDLQWRQPDDEFSFFGEDLLDDIFGGHQMDREDRESKPEKPSGPRFSAIWTPEMGYKRFGDPEDEVVLPEVKAPVTSSLPVFARPKYTL